MKRDIRASVADSKTGSRFQLQRNAPELVTVNYIGGIAAVVLAGYAIHRFYVGDILFGIVNLAILAALITALTLVYVNRYRQWSMIALSLIITAACVASAMIIGGNGLLWAYLVLWVNLLLLAPRIAVAINLAAIVTLGTQAQLFTSLNQQLTWVTVALLVSGMGLIFGRELRKQRHLLHELIHHDPLTRTGNRRLMQQQLEQALAEFRRHRRPSTLVVLDLDHFKRVNDEHGHEAGDGTLRKFARSIGAVLRTEDGFYRMGGEEFVILLRDVDDLQARETLPELHQRLSGRVEGPNGPIRFSAGAAVLQKNEDWSRWLGRADNALYQAKRAGRDRLIIAPASA